MMRRRVKSEAKQGALRTVWFFLRPYKRRLVVLLALCILVGYLETMNVALLYPILDASLGMEGGLSGNPFFAVLDRVAGIIPVDSTLVSYCILFILSVLLVFVLRVIYLNFSVRTTAKVTLDYKLKVFAKFTRSDYQFFVDHREGDLLYLGRGAPEYIPQALDALTKSAVEIIMAISVLVLLISISWKATIFVVLGGSAYYYFARRVGNRISYVAGQEMQAAHREENVALTEYICGAKQIITARASPRWTERFRGTVTWRLKYWARNKIWLEIPTRVLEMLFFSVVGIVIIAIWMMYPADFQSLIPLLGTFAFAVFKLLPRLSTAGTQLMALMSFIPNLEATRHVLEDESYSTIRNGTRDLPALRSGIELRNVTFTHKTKEAATVSGVSMRVDKNKVTAVVGPSGSGKSTLVDLVLRLYDVDEGAVLVDGIDIREYDLSSYLARVGFVGQETFIYNASVRDNIAFGVDYDIDQIVQAAQMANADGFIQGLPQGYDTVVGDRGLRLSGGERQRIAVARAMIRKPQILVLDEATSALDNISQRLVQDAIDRVSESCTTLVVAHRLSTIRNADMIYVINHGQVVESGTHDELVRGNGKYSELYQQEEGSQGRAGEAGGAAGPGTSGGW